MDAREYGAVLARHKRTSSPDKRRNQPTDFSPLRKHSQKPPEARVKIKKLMGELPAVELFAREKTPGWDVWGNEVESDIEIKEAKNDNL